MFKIALKPSAALTAILLTAHAAAIAMLVIVDMAAGLKFAFSTAVAISLVYSAGRHAFLRSPSSVVAIEIASDNTISVQLRSGDWIECEVLGDTFVTSLLTVVNLRRRDTRRRISVTVLPDSMDAEDFRKLRVWLRWKPNSE